MLLLIYRISSHLPEYFFVLVTVSISMAGDNDTGTITVVSLSIKIGFISLLITFKKLHNFCFTTKLRNLNNSLHLSFLSTRYDIIGYHHVICWIKKMKMQQIL